MVCTGRVDFLHGSGAWYGAWQADGSVVRHTDNKHEKRIRNAHNV